jgi:3-hydroxy-9,10-secoandrosta-1,3,5(10)-triene-9,17-dione monooxygenase reductase component
MTTTRFDVGSYRNFFGQLPTGVTVLVAGGAKNPVGLVVGTFSSVSLDPPLVSFMVRTESSSYQAVREQGRFSANILASDQGQVSKLLAGWSPDKFRDVALDETDAGALVVHGCLAWADCIIEREIEAGDHIIILARPLELTVARRAARPLVFCQSAYHRTLRVEDARAPGWI